MIKLHQFPGNQTTVNFSPFCLKLEAYLRMAKLPFTNVTEMTPQKAPKGKLPFIDDNGHRLGDSGFIVDYLEIKYKVGLDAHLSPAELATGHAFRRMVEESLVFALLYSRWVDPIGWERTKVVFFRSMPKPLQKIIPPLLHHKMKRRLNLQGIGKHSKDEVYKFGCDDLTAISEFLGDKAYLLGDRPSSFDASMFGFLNNIINDIRESPLKKHAISLANLKPYCQRIKDTYFE